MPTICPHPVPCQVSRIYNKSDWGRRGSERQLLPKATRHANSCGDGGCTIMNSIIALNERRWAMNVCNAFKGGWIRDRGCDSSTRDAEGR